MTSWLSLLAALLRDRDLYTASMRREVAAAALVAIMAVGCGRLKSDAPDSGSLPDDGAAPATPEGGAAPDAPARDAGGSADAVDTAADSGVASSGRPLPDGVSAPARFFDTRAILVGNGHDACTHQTPASGDGHRWCGFIVGAGASGIAELWVIDVTRVSMGDVPACDGSNAGCLRLTDKVDTRSAAFFDGDTLIYGTDRVSGAAPDFLGRLLAWRPGWSAGRQISSDAGINCLGNVHSAAAACLDDPAGDPAKRDSANVRAGYLSGETGGALPVFGRWPLRNDNETAWQAGFSPDGSIFVLSDADTIGATRTLRLSLTADVGQVTPAVTLEDVTFWQISNDGQKIYFIRVMPQQSDLYVADFPTGANARPVETDVLGFALLGDQPSDQAVSIVKDEGANGGLVELLHDRSVPVPKALFAYTGVLNGAIVSPDFRYTTWLDDSFRGIVFRNADLATCNLDLGSESPVYEPSYLASSSLMFWKEIAPGDNSSLRNAFFASPDGCRLKQQFGTHVDLIKPVGDRGVVFEDELDAVTGRATLKYIAASADGATLDMQGAVRIQGDVSAPVVFVGTDPPLLVYEATGPTAETSGLFVFGPVPF